MVPFASRRVTLLAMSSLALGVFMIDHSTQWLEPARDAFSRFLFPIIEVSHLPTLAAHQSRSLLKTKQELINHITHLEAQAAGRAFQLQRYTRLIAENQRLRDILDLQQITTRSLTVAEVILLRITTLTHKAVIDKGAADGIVAHSIVFDSQGVVGQIHSVQEHHSWVTLMSDPEHSIPVELPRTGVRGVLQGVSDLGRLEVSYIPETADVQISDMVVTSGLGGRFPAGYPLATVSEVTFAEHKSFASIDVTPQAQLSQLRFLFVMPPIDTHQYQQASYDDPLDEIQEGG